jgi:hypothetical protein
MTIVETAEQGALRPAAGAVPVSVLFITYRRVPLLAETSGRLRALFPGGFAQTVVADDGSSPAEQAAIRALGFDRCVLAPRNAGLGANNNAGLRACDGDLVLMLQDDWMATAAFPAALEQAIWILRHDPEVGMVRFAGGEPSDFRLQARPSPFGPYYVCRHDQPGAVASEHIYSDTPHLRRAALLDPAQLGPYREGCAMEECEEEYSCRFEAQSRVYIAFPTDGPLGYFDNVGGDQSHRTRKFRYRLDEALVAGARLAGLRREGAAYRTLRALWFSTKARLIRAGLLR